MKKIFLLASILLATFFVNAQGIQFENYLSWEQIKAKAKEEKKSIFLDFYGTWCAPCNWMDQNVYNQPSVGDYMNQNFINVKVQQDRSSSDSEFTKSWYNTAQILIKQYSVSLYPTIVFTNSEGIPLFRMDGTTYQPDSFIKGAKMSLNPDSNFIGKLSAFQKGKRDPMFVLDLIMHAQELGLDEEAGKIAAIYTTKLNQDQLFTKDNLMIVFKTTISSKDKGFPLFLNQKKRIQQIQPLIAQVYSDNLTDKIIRDEDIVPYLKSLHGKPDWVRIESNLKKWGTKGRLLFLKEEYNVAGELAGANPQFVPTIRPLIERKASWEDILAAIRSFNSGKGEERLIGLTMISFMNRTMMGEGDFYDQFYQAARHYEESFSIMINSHSLNNWAWFSFLKTNDKTRLTKAVEWSKKSLALDPNSIGFMDTYANLLYKVGKNQEAIQIEGEVAAKDPNNVEFKDTLEKMKKGEPTWNR